MGPLVRLAADPDVVRATQPNPKPALEGRDESSLGFEPQEN